MSHGKYLARITRRYADVRADLGLRGDYHFYVAAQATNLLQLMIALVIDLDLNKAPKRPGFLPGSLVEDVSRDKGVAVRPPHTLEEMRALLGCFYLNSL